MRCRCQQEGKALYSEKLAVSGEGGVMSRDQLWRCSAMKMFKGKKGKWSQLITEAKREILCQFHFARAADFSWSYVILPTLCCAVLSRSVRFSASQWTITCQTPLSVGILQARIPECIAMPSLRGPSQHRDGTQASCIAGGLFTFWSTMEAQE